MNWHGKVFIGQECHSVQQIQSDWFIECKYHKCFNMMIFSSFWTSYALYAHVLLKMKYLYIKSQCIKCLFIVHNKCWSMISLLSFWTILFFLISLWSCSDSDKTKPEFDCMCKVKWTFPFHFFSFHGVTSFLRIKRDSKSTSLTNWAH